MLAAIFSTLVPDRWVPYAVFVAAAYLLLGAAGVGGGVEFIGIGIAALGQGDAPWGAAWIGCGLTFIGMGAAVLTEDRHHQRPRSFSGRCLVGCPPGRCRPVS